MDQHNDAVDRLNSVPISVAERVINVHTTKPFQWVVDNVFSEEKCGKRNKILFWKSDKPGSCHFFIEFANKDSVSIAQKEAGPGVTVHCLSRNMNMAYVFDCLYRGIDPPKKRAQPDTDGSQHGDPPDSAKHPGVSAKRQRIYENEPGRRPSPPPGYRDVPHKPYRPGANFSQNPRDGLPRDVPVRDPSQRNPPYVPKSKQNWNSTVNAADNRDTNRRYQSGYNQKARFRNSDVRSANGSVSPPRRPKDEKLYYGDDERGRSRERGSSPVRPAFRRSSDTSMRRPSEASLKRPSDLTTTTSNDAPTQFSSRDAFDLTNLDLLSEDNILAVIDSLKSTFSGPETWVTVAAAYRRKGMHKNALAVVDSMLEVLRDRGMEKPDLRPALLLMAQCHYSIAKQEMQEPDSLEASSRHFVLLLDWLRETYGPFTPVLDAIAQSANRDPSWSSQKEGTSSTPYDFSQPGYDPASSSSLFDTHSSVAARLEAVSEENKRLRESRSATSAELAACRTALHEAENLARLTEVKLQRALEDLRLASSSAVRESEARRRAEDRLISDRKTWERRTEELREEGARSAMRELTAILTLSARTPLSALEATRVFCEARGRVERDVPNTA